MTGLLLKHRPFVSIPQTSRERERENRRAEGMEGSAGEGLCGALLRLAWRGYFIEPVSKNF